MLIKAFWLSAITFACIVPFCDAGAQGREACRDGNTRLPPIVNFRVDNDLFGGQDQGYSNGVQLTLVSPNLRDYTDDPCLPRPALWVNRYLEALQAEEFDQQNMIATFAQGIFTPNDFSRADLIENDRPYAAVLLVGLGYNARLGDRLRTTRLQVGVVGPAAMGEQVQNVVHRITGSERFQGWDNQLENEPVLWLQHERMHRISPNGEGNPGWGWDAIGHYGGSLGNLTTYANIGGEFRFGYNLPDDFGSTPLRPAGENTAPTRRPQSQYTPGFHLFLTTDARWVLHDITLDGNLFRRSHSVDKRPLVAYVGYGVALMRNRWKFALARYHSSREFDQQREPPVFGSFTISRAF